MRLELAAALVLVAACSSENAPDYSGELAPADVVSGSTFLQPDTRALQEDHFANPGFLWVDKGRNLYSSTSESDEACSNCHGADGDELAGVAAHYPAVDETTGKLLNIEGRINQCRQMHQKLDALPYESEPLLALTAYVSYLSRSEPASVDISGAAEDWYARGRDLFFTRRGQYNLSCHQCHDENWGKQLRGDTISQGHGNAFPAYRFEWQTFGSLQRRLRDCDSGIRAEPLDYGADDYLALELYLAKRAEGLALESPGVRR